MNINAYMRAAAKEALTSAAALVKDVWRDYIQSEFYEQYSPKEYKRTYQLLNSLVVTDITEVNGVLGLKIFMDYENPTKGGYNNRIDVLSVWELASQGYHGLKSQEIQTEGRFMERVREFIESGKFKADFAKILKEKGFALE